MFSLYSHGILGVVFTETERDRVFNQMKQEKKPEIADQRILDVFTSEGNQANRRHLDVRGCAHSYGGSNARKQALFREQLCTRMANQVHAATLFCDEK